MIDNISVSVDYEIKIAFKEDELDRLYCQAIFLLYNYVFSGIVVLTKKHTERDQDKKEGLRVNRAAFVGDIVLHTNRKQVINPLIVSQKLLKSQGLKTAKYQTIEEIENELYLRLEQGEELKINWIYPNNISLEMARILEVFNNYKRRNPYAKGSIYLSHEQKTFRVLDVKSHLAVASLSLANFDSGNSDLYGEHIPRAVSKALEYLLSRSYTEIEIRKVLQLIKNLLPESKPCQPTSFKHFIKIILEEYFSENGFFRKAARFVSKVNRTAGGVGVIEWSEAILDQLTSGIYDLNSLQNVSEELLDRLVPRFATYIGSQLNSPNLKELHEIERFIVNNGLILQEYLVNKNGEKVEKSINFLQITSQNDGIGINNFVPILSSEQIVKNRTHTGNIIQIINSDWSFLADVFEGTTLEGEINANLLSVAYATLLYLILSTVPSEITNEPLVSTPSEFDVLPNLYSGIDLMEKYNELGSKEIKIVEINPRFTGCVQPLARVLQESRKRNVSIQELLDRKKIVSNTFYFNLEKVSLQLLEDKNFRDSLSERLLKYLNSNLELDIMLISFQVDSNSARITYCYLLDKLIPKNEILVDIHKQEEIIFNFE